MNEFKQGDRVRLSKAGVKHVKNRYVQDIMEDPGAFPLNGEVGTVLNKHSDYYAGKIAVDFEDYFDYLKPKHLILESESDFPTKVPAYEVRIGDVIKTEEGKKFRVNSIVDPDGFPAVFEFRNSDYNSDTEDYRDVYADQKVKVFSREYK